MAWATPYLAPKPAPMVEKLKALPEEFGCAQRMQGDIGDFSQARIGQHAAAKSNR
jgi:hypothetical protein